MSIGHIVIILCALGKIGAELHVFYEYAEMVSVDPEYFNPEKTDVFINDDDLIAMNCSLVKKISPETIVHYEILEYSMGEYVLPTGINFRLTLCEFMQEPIINAPFIIQMGMSPDSSPPETGNYILDGYDTPIENMPETFRENKYRVVLDLIYEVKTLLSLYVDSDVRN